MPGTFQNVARVVSAQLEGECLLQENALQEKYEI